MRRHVCHTLSNVLAKFSQKNSPDRHWLLSSQVVLGAIFQSCILDYRAGLNPVKAGYISKATLSIHLFAGLK